MATFARVTVGRLGFSELNEKIDELNKRAARHGLQPIETVVQEVPFVPVRFGRFRPCESLYHIDINGCEPCINGWRLVAVADCVDGIVKIVPGVDDDGSFAAYRDHDGKCEHCNTSRRRNDVFVLEHNDGHRKCVGRNCLADFIRSGDADTLAKFAEFADKVRSISEACCADPDEPGGYGRRGGPAGIDLQTYLTGVSMLTRRFGWAARSKSEDGQSTADCADYYFNNTSNDCRDWIVKSNLEPSAGDADLAASAIEWAKSCDTDSEYMFTINKIANCEELNWKLDGFAASIIIAYQKACDRLEKRNKESVDKDFIGSPKERLTMAVKVVRVRYTEGYYGTKTIVAMEASLPNGVVAPITWFASGSKEFTEGADYTMTATVKSHDDSEQWGKQTIVTRAKLVELVAA